ncbi:SDR family NAD(P)-dependent oxidoreductase [Micromonospora sp. NPDC049523]|uniref:SDR family oxidoreductase n=1 Tax=Micromonospora sp. NPDC049523 TaxID=3155921 RepID=UPI003427E19A
MTGGTSGIGLGLALRFRDLGNRVIVSGRRTELLERIAAEHEGIDTVPLDVTDPDSIRRAYESVTRTHPEVNVLINIAGMMLPENLLDPAHLAVAESTVATNLLGPIRTIASFAPYLATKEQATIINVSSGLAFVPLPLTPTYDATKAGIHFYTEALRAQLADSSIQVIELVPPPVRTTMMNQENNEQSMPLEDFLSETMDLLQAEPDAREILVENVKWFRFAERNGTYDETFALVSRAH